MMIFVTAGTQLPFDRLVETVDEIAPTLKDANIIVQALKSNYDATNIHVQNFLSSADFDKYMNEADLIISHAGTGTIISALVNRKPIIVIPRLLKFNEHRNDHQLATAKQMDKLKFVQVAYNELDLKSILHDIWPHKLSIRHTIANEASHELINSINKYIKY